MKKIKFIAALTCAVILCVSVSGCLFQRQETERPIISNTYVYDAESDDYFVNLSKECMQSIVEINVPVSSTKSYKGSGVIIYISSTRTYIITNNHVVSGESLTEDYNVFVKLPNESGDGLKAEVLYRTNKPYSSINPFNVVTSDLAIIAIDKQSAHTVCKYSVDELKYGQHVLAVGNGLGYGTSVCDGLIGNPSLRLVTYKSAGSSIKTFDNYVIQSSAPINSGNSGGGLFDMKARLIGINTFKAVTAAPGDDSSNVYAEGISFTLPMSHVKEFVDKWNETQEGVSNGQVIKMTKG